MDMYLIYTGITRSSTNILQTINVDNSVPLLEDVVNLEKSKLYIILLLISLF